VIPTLEAHGFFEGEVLAAHCVWSDETDIAVYARHAVGVAHCPQSNAKLGAGIAPLTAFIGAGLEVGLGTDSAATNNNLNLWEEVRLAPLLANARALDPTAVSARRSLDMATRGGARAIGRTDIGVLAAGYKADLISVRLDDTRAVPAFGPESYVGHVVYSLGRELVDAVWVNGRQVVKSGEMLTVDTERIRSEAQRRALALAERVTV
jgi:5-methylthioadenosine/S-adenosylhomocysteine deaminase